MPRAIVTNDLSRFSELQPRRFDMWVSQSPAFANRYPTQNLGTTVQTWQIDWEGQSCTLRAETIRALYHWGARSYSRNSTSGGSFHSADRIRIMFSVRGRRRLSTSETCGCDPIRTAKSF